MYFRLPNVFVASYIDTEESSSNVEQPGYELPQDLLVDDAQSLDEKIELAQRIIRWSLDMCPGKVVLSTSFGIQSAIMLHLVSTIDKSIPVIWIDTGYLPPETYHYAAELKALLDLNVHIFQSDISPAHMEAIHGKLWEQSEPNAHRLYGLLRKVIPMKKAQQALNASLMLSGVRRSQTNHRKNMSVYSPAASNDECGKVCPILSFTDEDTVNYFQKYSLPPHPLVAQGYTSVGDAHSSRPKLDTDKDDRATRFGNNNSQQECGLHTETGTLEEYDHIISKALKKEDSDQDSYAPLSVTDLPAGYVVFGRVACKYCKAAKALLASKGLTYTEFMVVKPGESDDEDKDSVSLGQLVQLVKEATNEPDRNVSTVPQIFLDNEYIGGFSELCPKLDLSAEGAEALVLANSSKKVDDKKCQNNMSHVRLAGCEAGLPKDMADLFVGKI